MNSLLITHCRPLVIDAATDAPVVLQNHDISIKGNMIAVSEPVTAPRIWQSYGISP